MIIEFELDEIKYGNETAYSGVLVIEGSIETDELSGEAWGTPFRHETSVFEAEDATLFVYGHDGEEIAQLNEVDYLNYISEDELQDAALKQ